MLTDKGIARKMNLEHLSATECEKILQVLQKDFELRQKEKSRLEKIEEDLKEEDTKIEVLAKKTKLNENVCIRCCQRFGLIFNRKQTCTQCHLNICKSCCSRDLEKGGFVCNVCVKEHELKLKSCDWFYNNVSRRFKRFGSAKVVRTLYKQRGDSDNESDSGYDPSLYSSFKSASLQSVVRQRPALAGLFPDKTKENNNVDPVLPPPPQFESDLFTKPQQAPVVITPIQTANQNTSLVDKNTENQEDDSRDIYKEAFLSTKEAEEKRFEARFTGLLSDLQLSLQNQSPNGVSRSPSYGGVMVTYTSRLREILVGLSQRLELAIESFDNNSNHSTEATSDKVRQLVSKLVENSLGESIDFTSDEAVSDLSSLSDDDSEAHKSFEDHLAQAVISKVLENHRKEVGLKSLGQPTQGDVIEERGHKDSVLSSSTIDQGHGDSLQNSDTDQDQVESLHEDDVDNFVPHSPFVVIDQEDTQDIKEFKSHQCQTDIDYKHQSDLDSDKNRSEGEVRGHEHNKTRALRDSITQTREYEDDQINDELELNSHEGQQVHQKVKVHNVSDKREVKVESANEDIAQSQEDNEEICEVIDNVIEENIEETTNTTEECAELPIDPLNEIKKLKSFLGDISPRPRVREVAIEDETCDVEEPIIEPELVHREESQQDFYTKCSVIDYAHEHTPSLPDFDVSDFELNSNEIDPDLLSMNLAPILEEDEEGEEEDSGEEKEQITDWRGNWIFKGNTFVSPYANMGKKQIGGEVGQIYMTIPEPYQELAPRVGNRSYSSVHPTFPGEASDIFSDLSDEEENEDNLSDEETSFYAKTSEEIARITRKGSYTQSVQTDDSDLDTSREQWASDSGVKVQSAKVEVSESSADDSKVKPAKKLIEELIPAENDDPKFEIPPESITVPEGEPAKFSCRVAGTDPTDVFWYKVEDELMELEESEQFEISRDGNKHHMTMYYPGHQDAGQYMAIAVNENGRCCQYLVLKVKKNSQDLKAPEFLKGIKDVEVFEGQNVKFRCKVKGYPQPRVIWYKDGKRMTSNSNCKLEKYGNRDYLMTIDCATLDEDAEYTVMAKNIAGEVKSSAQLIVEPEQPEETFNSVRTTLSQSSFSSSFSDDRRRKPTTVTESLLSTGNEKNAAKNIREVTSSSLNVLNLTRETIHSDREDDGCLATSTPRQEGQSQDQISKTSELSNRKSELPEQVSQNKWYNSPSYPVESFSTYVYPSSNTSSASATDTMNVSSEIVSPTENMAVQSEIVLPSSSISEYKHSDSQKEQTRMESLSLSSTDSKQEVGQSQEVELHQEVEPQQEVETHQEVEPHQEAELQKEMVPQQEEEPQQEVQSKSPQSPRQPKVKVVTVVNMGPKKLESTQFNRDFFVNTTPKMPRKHWDVNTSYTSSTPPVNRDNSQDQIDMTASIDEKEHKEIDEIEDTQTDVHYTEQDVSSVNQIKLRAPPTTIIGQTSEWDLPESRTELNEESGIKELPSVNRLKAMFSNPADESSIKRDETPDAVHSITARTVPKEKLERFRRTPSSDFDETAEREQSRSHLSVNLAPTPKITSHDEPTQIFPETKGETFPASVSKQAPIKTTVTSQVKVQPQSPVVKKKKVAPVPEPNVQEVSTAVKTEKKTTPRIRSGCIAARANFWEKKIQDPQDVLEEDFPDMVVHVQE
ncbi:LOW QUALITY PROTEIN: titin homolog [Argopecten irradians]|uniref:LOW QUALITY PROTEIN: titin homolog n=1 Tax=Argopecten irradians TaxID=31199 RepID=UPI0037129D76